MTESMADLRIHVKRAASSAAVLAQNGGGGEYLTPIRPQNGGTRWATLDHIYRLVDEAREIEIGPDRDGFDVLLVGPGGAMTRVGVGVVWDAPTPSESSSVEESRRDWAAEAMRLDMLLDRALQNRRFEAVKVVAAVWWSVVVLAGVTLLLGLWWPVMRAVAGFLGIVGFALLVATAMGGAWVRYRDRRAS